MGGGEPESDVIAVLADRERGVEEPSGGCAELVDVGTIGDVDRPIAGTDGWLYAESEQRNPEVHVVNWRTVDLDGDGIAGAQMSAESENGIGCAAAQEGVGPD